MSILLSVEGLVKKYPDFTLSIDSLTVLEGEAFGIIGRNGSGKSTFLDLVLGERKRNAGKIDLFGLDNVRDEGYIKSNIGFVVDDAGFFDKFSLKDAAAVLNLIYKSWDGLLFHDILAKFNLDSRMKFDDLSRGMLIKSNLALALAHRPRLLILDEITSGLDPVSRIEVLELLRDYLDEDTTRGVIFSTHITDDLKRLADRVGFLDAGQFVLIERVDTFADCSIDDLMVEYEGRVAKDEGPFA